MLFMLPPKRLLYAGTRDPTCLSRAVVSDVKCPLNFWFRLRFGDISLDTFQVRRRPPVSCDGSPGINLLFLVALKKSGYSPRRIRLDTFPKLAYSISLWPVVFDKATYILLEVIVSLLHWRIIFLRSHFCFCWRRNYAHFWFLSVSKQSNLVLFEFNLEGFSVTFAFQRNRLMHSTPES